MVRDSLERIGRLVDPPISAVAPSPLELGYRGKAEFSLGTGPGGTVLIGFHEQGRPGRLALDVFDKEPITDASDPLINHPAVIATPHIGFVTEDELDLQFADIYDQIVAFEAGAPINVINPEVLAQ